MLSFFLLSLNTFHREKNKKKGNYGSVMEDLRTNYNEKSVIKTIRIKGG